MKARFFNSLLIAKNLEELKKDVDFDFHTVSIETLCKRYHTNTETGLTNLDALDGNEKLGLNELTPPAKTPGDNLLNKLN
jgi:hypothetical protein